MNNNNDVGNGSSIPNNAGAGVTPGTQSAGAPLNTTGSQTVPYDRFAEVNSQLRAEREARARLEQEKNELLNKSQSSTPDNPPLSADAEYYRTLLRVPDERKVKTEVLSEVEAKLQILENKRRQDEMNARLQNQIAELRTRYAGQDGILPAFDPASVMEYGMANNIYNPEVAYKQMYQDKFIEKAVKEAQSGESTTYVESPSSTANTVDPNAAKPFSELSLEEMEERLKQQGAWVNG